MRFNQYFYLYEISVFMQEICSFYSFLLDSTNYKKGKCKVIIL